MHHFDFTITQSSIDNGRIYFDSRHTDFFPPDVFGGRSATEHAPNRVQIDVAGKLVDTDIRVSSAVRISPRASFKQWLTACKATEGSTARLHRISERAYRLEFIG